METANPVEGEGAIAPEVNEGVEEHVDNEGVGEGAGVAHEEHPEDNKNEDEDKVEEQANVQVGEPEQAVEQEQQKNADAEDQIDNLVISLGEQGPEGDAIEDKIENPKVEEVKKEEVLVTSPAVPAEIKAVRLDIKTMPNIEQTDFKILDSMTHSEGNVISPFNFEIEGPLDIEGKKRNSLFSIKIPTPENSIAKTTVIQRSIGNINLYAGVLAQIKGSLVSVPPTPYIKELYLLHSQDANKEKLELVKLFFEHIALHQELRSCSLTKAFFCVPREKQKDYFSQISNNFEVQNKESISDTIASKLKHGFSKLQDKTKRDKDTQKENMINDNVQKHVKNFIKTTFIELIEAAEESLELFKRSRSYSDEYTTLSKKLGKAIATIELANESASNDVLFRSAVAESETGGQSAKEEKIAGDVTIEVLNKFISERPFVPVDESFGVKGLSEGLGKVGPIYRSYSDKVLVHLVTRLTISAFLVRSLLPILKHRAKLVDNVIRCRKDYKKADKSYEHECEKKQRAQELGTKGASALAKREAECEIRATERRRAADELTNAQKDLISFTNGFFFSYNAVCVSINKHLSTVGDDVSRSMVEMGKRLKGVWMKQ